MTNIETGSVVVLKSGGPRMAVVCSEGGMVDCTWFGAPADLLFPVFGELRSGRFPSAALHVVEAPPPGIQLVAGAGEPHVQPVESPETKEIFEQGVAIGMHKQSLDELMQKTVEVAEGIKREVKKTVSDSALRLQLNATEAIPESDPRRVATDGITPGREEASAPGVLGPNGQHSSYWTLSEAERSKGFVRPVRLSYKHVGIPGPRFPLRPLTDEEKGRHADYRYAMYEIFPESELPISGQYWTQSDLDRVNNGCGTITSMSVSIAETYAREPRFYGSTFCVGCRVHLPVGRRGEFVWVEDDEVTDQRVGM